MSGPSLRMVQEFIFGPCECCADQCDCGCLIDCPLHRRIGTPEAGGAS